MNDRRTKILVLAAGAVLLWLVAETAYASLWSSPRAQANKELRETETALYLARALVADEKKVQEDWQKIRGLLNKRPENVGNHLVGHLESMFDRVGVKADVSSGSSMQVPGADFREYVFETRFKLTWKSFVDLLAELHNSREFLKPLRLNVASQYERDERLDVDLKVSTIEYAPLPSKPGAK